MPAPSKDLEALFTDLGRFPGDVRLMRTRNFGLFHNLQPFFDRERGWNQSATSQSPCAGYAPPDGLMPLQRAFNFDCGFQSASALIQKNCVVVYDPAPPPPPPIDPLPCHVACGLGYWSKGRFA